ncbi:hypothetical protein [Pseudomonas phage Astolliot]|nr:hypothetical protein [Pseudomonas phage Astolliot]
MKIDGLVTKVETVRVDIAASDMIETLNKQWLVDIGQAGNYISSEGKWEDWIDTGHGSGITKVLRDATDEEKSIYAAFRTIRGIKFSK